MPIETLNCPMCGAPTTSEAAQCEHCGARLAKVACPSCFGLIYQGAKFCSHCGAAVESTEVEQGKSAPCPRCRTVMKTVAVGPTAMQECQNARGSGWMLRPSNTSTPNANGRCPFCRWSIRASYPPLRSKI